VKFRSISSLRKDSPLTCSGVFFLFARFTRKDITPTTHPCALAEERPTALEERNGIHTDPSTLGVHEGVPAVERPADEAGGN
jgi:hypothetical protein